MSKLFLPILLFTVLISFGQNKPHREKIKSLKVAFITERLELNSKEAQQFWPVYNKYEENREELRQKHRTQIKSKLREATALTEKEAEDLLNRHISFEDEEEKLDKVFLKEISKVISARKTLLLLQSEDDFKRQLIKQYRNNKGGR